MSGGLQVRQVRAQQAVDAVRDQDDANASAQMHRRDPTQEFDTERHTESASDQEWQQALQSDGRAQLPYRVALDQQTERDDQRRRMGGLQHMQPRPGRDDAEGEPADPVMSEAAKVEARKIKILRASRPSILIPHLPGGSPSQDRATLGRFHSSSLTGPPAAFRAKWPPDM